MRIALRFDGVIGNFQQGDQQKIKGVEHVVFYLLGLAHHGYSVRIITDCTGQALEVVANWLGKNGLHFPIIEEESGSSKIVINEDIDVAVDTDFSRLVPLIGKVKHLLLFSSPFNKDQKEPKGVTRVNSWFEIYNYIRYEM